MDRLIREKQVLHSGEYEEFRISLFNPTDEEIFVEDITLLRADSLESLGIQALGCRVFRSGRHKNDMPSVAEFGRIDGAMLDALSGMSESGDKKDAKAGQQKIISDHLTILGSEGEYCVLAFMTGRDQLFSTEIVLDKQGNFLSLESKVQFQRYIRPGETLCTEVLRIEHTADPQECIRRFARDKASLYNARVGKPLSVFCTWYYYGLSVTEDDVMTNLKRMKQLNLPFDVFQIDEGWETTLGHWEPNKKFPTPMKELADRIRESGYRPGIWTSPFVAKETAPVWQDHPEWILRDKQGNPCIFPMNDTTYWVFDITHPETHAYFTELYRHLTQDWGYTYHKLDFTRAGVIYPEANFSKSILRSPGRIMKPSVPSERAWGMRLTF